MTPASDSALPGTKTMNFGMVVAPHVVAGRSSLSDCVGRRAAGSTNTGGYFSGSRSEPLIPRFPKPRVSRYEPGHDARAPRRSGAGGARHRAVARLRTHR